MENPEFDFDDDDTYLPFRGGKGTSMEDAIIIDAGKTPWLGVNLEYQYIEMEIGRQGEDWHMKRQYLMANRNSKSYDKMVIKLKNGLTKEYFFDITSFYGKY